MPPSSIPALERVPKALHSLRAWLVWRYEAPAGLAGKPRKVPYYPGTGRRRARQQGSPEDRAQLVTLPEALRAARPDFSGVGLALLPGMNITALDFDACVVDGQVDPAVADLLTDTYCEISPSGTGVRAFYFGEYGDRKSNRETPAVEVFSHKGFVTVTGHWLDQCELLGNEDTVAHLADCPKVVAFLNERFGDASEAPAATGEPGAQSLTADQVKHCLNHLPADLHYDDWIRVGMAVHYELGPDAFDVWDEWSQRSPKYATPEYGRERWRSFGLNTSATPTTGRTLAAMANDHGAEFDPDPVSPDEFEDLSLLPEPPLRFQVVPAGEFVQRPPPKWIIKGVLPQADLIVLYGQPGDGKTFVALDLCMSIARGEPWRGKKVRQGRVVYVAAEGAGGFRNRLAAYAQHHQVELHDLPFGVIFVAPNILERGDVKDLIKSIGEADVVVFDTLAQVTPGANENAAEDMGKALGNFKRVGQACKATVLAVHHMGKDASKGARGWSGIKAAADAELEIHRVRDVRVLRNTKQKDGEDGAQWAFTLQPVTIGVDEDGEDITSCVLMAAEMPAVELGSRKLGPIEAVVVDVIQEMAQAQTQGIEIEAVLSEAIRRLPAPTDGKRDTRRMRARRALNSLTEGDAAPYLLHEDGTLEVL